MGLGLVGSVAFLVGAWLLLAFALQRPALFPGRRAPAEDVASRLPGLEVLWLGEGGAVEAWYLPAPGPLAGRRPALVFLHGNGELIDDWGPVFEEPRSWGVDVLLVEYPGYGRSGGRPSEASITRATLDAYDALRQRPGVDGDAIVAYGRSVGGGAACALAARRPLAALILESTFTGVRPLARRFGLPGFLVRDPFDNLGVVRGFERPILVLHGERDEIIPFRHGRTLARASSHARFQPLPCGHNDCPRPWRAIRAFLRETGVLEGSG